jgi:hypothetical protein
MRVRAAALGERYDFWVAGCAQALDEVHRELAETVAPQKIYLPYSPVAINLMHINLMATVLL